jgi:NADPH-dependent curcumin reductase CurA
MSVTSREVRLKSRPAGLPTEDNFEIAQVQVRDPAAGEVLVKNLWMTVDPYLRGRTVIGSAGGPDKIAYLKEIGVDHAIDYKAEKDLTAALLRAAPGGIDVYFENVGGEHMEAALTAAKVGARFAICGMIAQYNDATPPPGPRNMALIIGKSLRLEGYIVSNHFDMMPAWLTDLSNWIASDQIKWKETVEVGVENAPAAFIKLFEGGNIGKMLVKLG